MGIVNGTEGDFLREAERVGGKTLLAAQAELLAAVRAEQYARPAFDGAGLERAGYNMYVPNVAVPVVRVFADGEVQASAAPLRSAGRDELADVWERELPYFAKNLDYRRVVPWVGSARLGALDARAVARGLGFVGRHSAATWDIRRESRPWRDDAHARFELAPEKIEMVGGMLFSNDFERVTVLTMLLENLGIDRAVRIGRPEVWRQAVERLADS